MFINKFPVAQPDAITIASGAGSKLIKITHSILRQMIVKSATSTTTFDVTLTDRDGNIVYSSTDNTGELNELPDIPTWGWLTLAISNASVDEDFSYFLACETRTSI